MCPLPLYKWRPERQDSQMTDWGGRGEMVDSQIAAAEEEEMSHTRDRERARKRDCSLCVVHCRHLLAWQFERKGVCAQWGVLDIEKHLLRKRKKRPLVSDIKQSRTPAEMRPCTIPCETLYQGCVGCISPRHLAYTERLDWQKMMEFTIMSG